MKHDDCVGFLQWALPRLRLRWPGFRRVRRQVCQRLGRRLRELGLGELQAYQLYLGNHPAEWQVLDGLCRITISRFYRDRTIFVALEREVLPVLARQVLVRGEGELRA
jgi:chemotaxis protein methyltransferase CheR